MGKLRDALHQGLMLLDDNVVPHGPWLLVRCRMAARLRLITCKGESLRAQVGGTFQNCASLQSSFRPWQGEQLQLFDVLTLSSLCILCLLGSFSSLRCGGMACGDPAVGHEGQAWVSALWSGAILSVCCPRQVRQGVGLTLLPLLRLGSSVWKFKERIQCGNQINVGAIVYKC